jgi:hypothetical protein
MDRPFTKWVVGMTNGSGRPGRAAVGSIIEVLCRERKATFSG